MDWSSPPAPSIRSLTKTVSVLKCVLKFGFQFSSIFHLLLETVVKIKEKATKRKGRGFETEGSTRGEIGAYESVASDGDAEPGPQKCMCALLFGFFFFWN